MLTDTMRQVGRDLLGLETELLFWFTKTGFKLTVTIASFNGPL